MTDLHTPPSTYILRELHDVAVPESLSWVPQTIGWKILAVIGAIVLMYLGYRLLHHWWDNRYRKEAIEAISRLNPDDASMPKALFSILKIVLIHLDSSHARLFDTAFLRKLDALKPLSIKCLMTKSLNDGCKVSLTQVLNWKKQSVYNFLNAPLSG